MFRDARPVVYAAALPKAKPWNVIFGKKENLLAVAEKLAPEFSLSKATWAGVVNTLKPSTDAASLATTFTSAEETKDEDLKAVTFAALPTACSRHNSPALPFAIAKAMDQAKSSKEMLVVHVLEDQSADLAAARCVATARQFPVYNHKSTNSEGAEVTMCTVNNAGDAFDVSGSGVSHVIDSVRMAAGLVDMPCAELNTSTFTTHAQEVAKDLGIEAPLVISGTDLRDKGFGGLWGVGKAAEHPPALVVLKHTPEQSKDQKPVVFVGKGIVYDTGGLNIKVGGSMPGMKRDMGGAAAILGAFRALVKAGIDRPIACILCLAENSVGPASTRPDDVLDMYSGKTVEINNTDAEGRLVLADGVAYAVKHLNPHAIIDCATLTGAQGISTGKNHGALYVNNERLEQLLVESGRNSGDTVHPLPYVPEFYRGEFSSSVADMKNSVKDRANAQSSCAGQFIGNHLGAFETEGLWAHIDLAFPSFRGERGTGFGVALLYHATKRLVLEQLSTVA